MGQKGFLFVSRQQARCRAGRSACLLLLLRLLLLKLQQLLRVLDLLDLLVELLLLLVVHGAVRWLGAACIKFAAVSGNAQAQTLLRDRG